MKLHSAVYKSPAEWKGKHAVIVGTANTGKKDLSEGLWRLISIAHDVAVDMVKAGLQSVTMVQRSKTCMKLRFEVFSLPSTNRAG